ncbi:MAG: hypothetical protein DHS20C15_03980 [Planctomycetota bacterium]|nr:MAG: hypothetical protein DHS20C15_03980 [Planctomycetota bacterium]
MLPLVLALGPSLILLVAIGARRPAERICLAAASVAGFLAGVLVLELLPSWLARVRITAVSEWLQAVQISWSQAALPEETCKLLVLLAVAIPLRPSRAGWMRAGAVTGLGYAAFENLLHTALRPDAVPLVLLRSLTSLPAHALFGVFMGALAGRGGLRSWLAAWLAAMALHTAYDTPLLLLSRRSQHDAHSWIAVGVLAALLVGGWLTARHLARRLEATSN